MKKRLLALALALIMTLGLFSVTALADSGITEIGTAEQLAAFAAEVNGGDDYAGKTVKLTADITLSDAWTPIGNGSRSGKTYTGSAFKGTFDGDNHTITGLTITATSGADAALGLFGVVDGGTVKNLKLDSVNINVASSELVGAAIGLMVGGAKAENITVSGTVAAKRGNGGVVGRMLISGTIKNCVNNADVSATGGANVGGIVGAAYYTAANQTMTIEDCTNNGTVTSTSYCAGGIVGFSAAKISGCRNTANVSGKGNGLGGIVGEQQNYGSITGCTNSGSVTNGDNNGYSNGGIVGWVRYNGENNDEHPYYTLKGVIEVKNNVNSGVVSGGHDAGGIVGRLFNAANITGNENTAASLTATEFAAGIVGSFQIRETPVQGSEPSETIPQQTLNCSNNISTTAIESITATGTTTCVDQYVWDNTSGTQDGKIENNASDTNAWVAKIGEDKYTSLTDAIADADGKTVKLLRDITLEYGGSNTIIIPEGKNITLDLNGKKINSAAGRVIDVRGELTIVGDGDINGATVEQQEIDSSDSTKRDYYNGYQVIDVNGANAKLTMASGTINAYGKNGYGMYGITVKNGASIVLGDDDGNGPTVNAYCAAVGTNNLTGTADVTIKGGIYTTEVSAESPDEEGAYFCAAIYAATPGIYNIQGGTFNGYYAFSSPYKNAEQQVNISGGTFNGTEAALFVGDAAGSTSGTRAIAVSGGTFSSDPSAYTVEGYVARRNADGTYGVVDKNASSTGNDLAWLLPVLGALEKEPFDDVKSGDWFYDDVQYAYETGLMTGTASRTFSPNAPVTRGMVMTILARREGIMTDHYSPWYAAGVEWAVANGISDGSNPEGKITREELATMLYRYAKLKGYDLSGVALTGYADANSVSTYAVSAMQWAVGSGLMNGSNGKLTPRATATRAQLAAILHRFFG